MVIRDVRIDRLRGTDVNSRMVRRYQPAVDGLHVLITTCKVTSDSAPCDAALDGVKFTVADSISLHDSVDALSYRLGEACGMVLGVGAPLLVLLYVVRRRSRARAAAVRAAGPPGSPPGPGAAAGGT